MQLCLTANQNGYSIQFLFKIHNISRHFLFSGDKLSGTDNKIKTSNNYEFLSFDNHRSKDGGEKCSSWEFHGIETFEFMVMGIFTIFMLVKGIRKFCGKGGYLEKRKETKLKRDAAKFEKLRSKFENIVEKDKTEAKGPATATTKEPAKDSHTVAFVL